MRPSDVPAMTSPSQTDHALLSEFAGRGSQPAFRALTDRYTGLVYAAAYRRTGRRELAEEVAQNVFAVLARKAGALARPDVKLAAWLHRAAVLEASRALRKESIRQRIMDDYFHHADVLSAQDAATWQAVLPELDSALDSLPSRDRELLLARFFEDRSYQELAAATGRSEAALMQQQHRALEKLSVLLQRRSVAVPVAVLAAGLGSALGPSAQAAPAGLAASLAATAPAAAASVGILPLVLHSLDIAMHTKTRLTLAAALAACLLGGSGAFWVGKSRAEARGEVLLAVSQPAVIRPGTAAVPAGAPAAAAPALDIRAKLERAVAGWRANTEHRRRMQALEIVDALAPADVPIALEVLAGVKDDYGLHLALGKRIAMLWGAQEPEPALKWLVTELPREHRGEPIQAILTGWSERNPQAALAWWQEVMDSLDFPIPENQFEGFEQVIYTGWANLDPVSLAKQLPEIASAEDLESHLGTAVEKQLMGLATAAVNPATRDATLAAIAAIAADGTRAAAAGVAVTMMNVSDAAVARHFVLSLKFTDPSIRTELLGETAMVGVMMQQQTPDEAVAWLRTHTDDATARRAVEAFVESHGEEELGELASELRAALEKP
jgi:RNA polymerase sigma factor (sigma-70 family)